jgi:molybdopterin-guanine dinucleotide biosynthesis adapter protein
MTSPPEPRSPSFVQSPAAPPAIAFVGFANSGKTEFICRLLPVLAARGLRVAVLKHSHHQNLEAREEGKDTWRYRQAGACATALAAPGFLQVTARFAGEPTLAQALAALSADADLILVEGYKSGPLPKVAVLGPGGGQEAPGYPNLIALVSDGPVDTQLPVFRYDQADELGRWLYDHVARD